MWHCGVPRQMPFFRFLCSRQSMLSIVFALLSGVPGPFVSLCVAFALLQHWRFALPLRAPWTCKCSQATTPCCSNSSVKSTVINSTVYGSSYCTNKVNNENSQRVSFYVALKVKLVVCEDNGAVVKAQSSVAKTSTNWCRITKLVGRTVPTYYHISSRSDMHALCAH